MKIQELQLLACGPFTGHCLDLSGGARGLHLIYGPNEAGKSSALRALKHLLFGFPVQSNDNFIHQYSALRVGACICNDHGEELKIVRRKANKGSLRSADDIAMVNEDDLRRYCGGVTEDRYSTFFGMDHSMLVQGGQKIIDGAGDVGQILFSGGGVGDLNGVLTALEQDAEQLFMPSARANRRLNQMLNQLADARKAVRDNQLPPKEWDGHYQSLTKALKRKQAAEADLRGKSREKQRLDRIRKALPLIAALMDVRNELSQVEDAILLPPDFHERRQAIQQDVRLAEDQSSSASKKIDEITRQLNGLTVRQALLDCRAVVEPLAGRLGVYQQAQDDRPGLEGEARQFEEAAIGTLRKVDKNLALADADSLQLTDVERLRIRTLSADYGRYVQDVDSWAAKVADLTRDIDVTQNDLAQLPALRDSGTLSNVLKNALKLGDVEKQLSDARATCDVLEQQASIDLKKLPLWTRTLEELEAVTVPLPETINRFEANFAESEQQLTALARQIDECEKEASALNQKIATIRLEYHVPTESDLQIARDQRQQGWQLVRNAWLAGSAVPETVQAFVNSVGSAGDDLASAFERSMISCDDIADRLRREADRVATHAQLLAQQDACGNRATKLKEERATISTKHLETLQDWKRHWEPLECDPLTPREMRAWIQAHLNLMRQSQSLRQHRDQVRQLHERVDEHRRHVSSALESLAGEPIPRDTSLSGLIATAQDVLDNVASVGRRHDELAEQLRRLQRDQDKGQEMLVQAKAKLESWQNQWKDAIAALPLDASSTPSDANAVLELLNTLDQQLRDAKEKRRRLSTIDSYATQFTNDVQGLAEQLSIPWRDLPVARVAADLGSQLANAIVQNQSRILLQKQLTAEKQLVETAIQTVRQANSQLGDLCTVAACTSAADLPAAEERSDRRRDLEAQARALEQQMREMSAGQSVVAFIAEANAADADAIDPQIQQLDDQITELDRELKDDLGPRIGAEKHALEQMDTSARAADAAEHVQDLISRIAADAEEYARLRIAFTALRKGIERYRERHQGPIMQRASRLFSELTIGSFSGLREDYDTDGQPELVGVRAEAGNTIRIEEMSDGTADQLYLAVRLAWLEEYLDGHETMPFIVDDLLIRFDNDRAVATLKSFAELSRRTQVIYFTHHEHIVELARRKVDSSILFVHELPRHIATPHP